MLLNLLNYAFINVLFLNSSNAICILRNNIWIRCGQNQMISLSSVYNIQIEWVEMSRKGIQLPSFITKMLPSANDEFHDGSGEEDNTLQQPKARSIAASCRTIKITKQPKKHYKAHRQHGKQRVIQIESDEANDENGNEDNLVETQVNNKFENNLIHIIELDDQQIQYYKSKLNILPSKQEDIISTKPQELNKPTTKFIPPQDIPKVPKFIYEYPPYPLGPTDTWPPKYPNSWRSFKKEMRECRKLQ